KEYAYQYAYSYAKLWNSIIFNGNPMKLSAYHDSFKYINTHYFIGEEYEDIIVGGDVKNKLKKLFDTPEMRARVIKDQMARAERQAKE
ncbi:hypothetical protein, partial [Cephaloticoccus primus]|uniref:hypothetical protein n=1 Tax=Cephaloticoccus primus TaxID=1548207 RepID=UPI001E653950